MVASATSVDARSNSRAALAGSVARYFGTRSATVAYVGTAHLLRWLCAGGRAPSQSRPGPHDLRQPPVGAHQARVGAEIQVDLAVGLGVLGTERAQLATSGGGRDDDGAIGRLKVHVDLGRHPRRNSPGSRVRVLKRDHDL